MIAYDLMIAYDHHLMNLMALRLLGWSMSLWLILKKVRTPRCVTVLTVTCVSRPSRVLTTAPRPPSISLSNIIMSDGQVFADDSIRPGPSQRQTQSLSHSIFENMISIMLHNDIQT